MSSTREITDEVRQQIAAAIRLIQEKVRWEPGMAEAHLIKRRLRGHLPADATLADYEHIISTVVTDDDATVYIYWHDDTPYVALVTAIEDRDWLVMFALDGVLETAFVVENPDRYLNKPQFEKLGTVGRVLT